MYGIESLSQLDLSDYRHREYNVSFGGQATGRASPDPVIGLQSRQSA